MKLFTKSLLAAAMLAGVAGGAQASIAFGNSTEAFLQVYDKTNGVTFDLDLGIDLISIFANQNTPQSVFIDLTGDANWTTFTSTLDVANAKYGVVVGNSTKAAWTTLTLPTPPKGSPFLAITNAIKNQAQSINSGSPLIPAENLSKLVRDDEAPRTGQWGAGNATSENPLSTLFGTYSVGGANASIPLGTQADFYTLVTSGTAVTTNKSPFVWMVSANGVEFNAPSLVAPTFETVVPLPAAVWMFGAGLLGMLGLNRRKAVA